MNDEDLTTAYMVGYHERDDEVAALNAEIERLRSKHKEISLEMRSLLQVTVGTLTDVEIQRDYGMLGWSVVKQCEELVYAG